MRLLVKVILGRGEASYLNCVQLRPQVAAKEGVLFTVRYTFGSCAEEGGKRGEEGGEEGGEPQRPL